MNAITRLTTFDEPADVRLFELSNLPKLSNNTIQLLLFDIEKSTLSSFKSNYHMLSRDEKSRCHQFRFIEDKARYAFTRSLTRTILGHYTKTSPEAVQFIYSDEGKPALSQENTIRFNISHSVDYFVIALHPYCDLGVDLEQVAPDENYMSIAKNYFHQRECESVINSENRKERFYQYWTLKEAFVKGVGKGFYYPFKEFSVERPKENVEKNITDRNEYFNVYVKDQVQLLGWKLYHQVLCPELHMALSFNLRRSDVKVNRCWFGNKAE